MSAPARFARSRNLGFTSPQFDVPLKNARWTSICRRITTIKILRHHDARNRARAGNLVGEFFHPRLLAHGAGQKASAKVEMDRDVSEARRQLAGGNMREASATFNRARFIFMPTKTKRQRAAARKGFADRAGEQSHHRAK